MSPVRFAVGFQRHRKHGSRTIGQPLSNPMKRIAPLLAALLLAGCASSAPTQSQVSGQDPGPAPTNYEDGIRAQILAGLKDPDSAKFRFEPAKSVYTRANAFAKWQTVWHVKVWVNAKNSLGGYTGEQPYWWEWKDGKVVSITRPWEVPTAQWGQP